MNLAQRINYGRLHMALMRLGWEMVRDEWALTLVGVRSAVRDSNRFNDALCVAWYQNHRPSLMVMNATTDPGLYWRRHPMNPLGTAQLKPGRYDAIWRLGLHRGQYEALVQRGECTVYRDNDGDDQLDGRREDTGLFGINLHRAADSYDTPKTIHRWSAGCQVVPDSGDYGVLMALCKQHARHHGNAFTYTLIEENDLWNR